MSTGLLISLLCLAVPMMFLLYLFYAMFQNRQTFFRLFSLAFMVCLTFMAMASAYFHDTVHFLLAVLLLFVTLIDYKVQNSARPCPWWNFRFHLAIVILALLAVLYFRS